MYQYFLNTSLETRPLNSLSVLEKMTGNQMFYLDSGRPYFSSEKDIAVSHKENYFCSVIVDYPYIVGIDIENINEEIDVAVFLKNALFQEEFTILGSNKEMGPLCDNQKGVILWSIKESFFKCVDYKLDMKSLRVAGIKNNCVSFEYSQELEKILLEKKISKISCTVMRLSNSLVFCKTIGELA